MPCMSLTTTVLLLSASSASPAVTTAGKLRECKALIWKCWLRWMCSTFVGEALTGSDKAASALPNSTQVPGDAAQPRWAPQLPLPCCSEIRAPGLMSALQDTGGGNEAWQLAVLQEKLLSSLCSGHCKEFCACWA